MLSIDELAKKLGTSKMTIYNKIKALEKQLESHILKENNITYIDDIGEDIIKISISPKKYKRDETIKKQQEAQEKEQEQNLHLNKLIESLENQIEELRKDKERMENEQIELDEIFKKQIESLKDDKDKLYKELETKNKQIDDQNRMLENNQILLQQSQQKIFLLEQTKKDLPWWKKLFK